MKTCFKKKDGGVGGGGSYAWSMGGIRSARVRSASEAPRVCMSWPDARRAAACVAEPGSVSPAISTPANEGTASSMLRERERESLKLFQTMRRIHLLV